MSNDRSAHSPNGRNTSLDPTGMFRNRGRHVITAATTTATVPQDHEVPNDGHDTEQTSSPTETHESNNIDSSSRDDSQVEKQTGIQNSGTSSSEQDCVNSDIIETYEAQIVSTGSAGEEHGENNAQYESKRADINSEPHEENIHSSNEIEEPVETDSNMSTMGNNMGNDLDEDEGLRQIDMIRWKSARKRYKNSDHVHPGNLNVHTDGSEDSVHDNEPMESRVADETLHKAILNDKIIDCDEESVPVSTECHIDTLGLVDKLQIATDGSVDNDETRYSNVVKVADFSKMEKDTSNATHFGDLEDNCTSSQNKPTGNTTEKDTINRRLSPIHKIASSPSKFQRESPLRLAFRRTENNIRRIASPRLPTIYDHSSHESVRMTTSSHLPLPLKLARKCFSFDDTTLDDDLAMPYLPELGMSTKSPKKNILRQQHQTEHPEYYGLSAVASFPSEVEDLKKTIPLNTKSRSLNNRQPVHGSVFRGIQRSKTWNHHVTKNNGIKGEPLDQKTIFEKDVKSTHHLMHHQQSNVDTQQQILEATSLLSSIVDETVNVRSKLDTELKSLLCKQCIEKCDNNNSKCERCTYLVMQIINSIKRHSSLQNNPDGSFPSDEVISNAIDVFLQCYNFTRELSETVLTAETWLKSERCKINDGSTVALVTAVKDEEIKQLNMEVSNCREEIERLRSLTQHQHFYESPSIDRSVLSNISDDSIHACMKQDKSLILSSPHPVLKLSESCDESFARFERRMNADLKVESLKEIIRLKAELEEANRKIASFETADRLNCEKDPFPSDIEPITGNGGVESDHAFIRIAENIESSTDKTSPYDDLDEQEGMKQNHKIRLDDPCLQKELEEYRVAIIEANNAKHGTDLAQDISKSCDSEVTEQRMISVKMLDAENFVTEWDTVSPLPPPPDHGLHSPIVDTIITRWTEDTETQNALLKWAESVLDGSNPHMVPPLKISGLDHQLKEGFIMHVFPLLLRRKDIHVKVTSRATRTTSYDLAVSISPSIESASRTEFAEGTELLGNDGIGSAQDHRIESKHHLMAFRATCSGSLKENDSEQLRNSYQHFPGIDSSGSNAGSCFTAVTSPISNRTPTKSTLYSQTQRSITNHFTSEENTSFPLEPKLPIMACASPALVDDLSVGSSRDGEEMQKQDKEVRQSSIMSSISGALGLLSRKKMPAMPTYDQPGNNHSTDLFLTPQRQVSIPSYEDEHPYHRLVSAPPGKIGITFVEHRGHCMISNVNSASPLAGYVHPSDILIAIDDIPVSGLRTREIVKLLTEKKDHRRDLRMISSHDMNELIRPGTA